MPTSTAHTELNNNYIATLKIIIITIVVRALGSIALNLTKCLHAIGLQASLVRTMQKTVLLSAVHLAN